MRWKFKIYLNYVLDWTTTYYNFEYPNSQYICSKKKLFLGRIHKIFPNDSLSLLQVLVNVWRAPNIFYTSIVFYILKCVLHKQHFTSW